MIKYSAADVKKMRACNHIVAEVLNRLKEKVRPGVTTGELDMYSEELVRKKGAKPAFKGYVYEGKTYPNSLCISVNSEVVHGIPSSRVLDEGDIVSLDFGACYKGYYGDAAITVPVGAVSKEAAKLIRVTEQALYDGIREARAGNRLGDISAAVQSRVETAGFSVVRNYTGHGIGKKLHEDPQIPNYRTGSRGIELEAGMVLAIEPMVNEGTYRVKVTDNGWTVVTEDGKLSAHFEHSIAITKDGPDILSRMN